eukprot:CAMPEP_0185769380 /NCGR_PEP_ID=MMETSP1174-20130828/53622_1 /TAXON_ID=35687 /ORGANISM="Dictyocha speculum, Strain CCMP1381" /LENGTH=94 /DNA_ID=CAMNT_0028454417 /DNA_START=551 /DNA_END=835 /DNA_ORIENTATION=-
MTTSTTERKELVVAMKRATHAPDPLALSPLALYHRHSPPPCSSRVAGSASAAFSSPLPFARSFAGGHQGHRDHRDRQAVRARLFRNLDSGGGGG